VEFNWITPDYAEHYCIVCGEVVSVSDNGSLERVAGKPRRLNHKEKQLLR
jgi:hypothetical protein